jgi:hypothetical protein
VTFIIETLLDLVLRSIGWAVLKIVTLGRYRGWGRDDLLVEGAVGLSAIALAIYLAYASWSA